MYDLKTEIAELVRERIWEALEVGGNKTAAAELLGLESYQTLSNWMRRYNIAPACRERGLGTVSQGRDQKKERARERLKRLRADSFIAGLENE